MFQLVKVTNTSTGAVSHLLNHQESGVLLDLPSWAKCVAADSDGEVFAYESGNIGIHDGHTAWQDKDVEGRIQKIGSLQIKGEADAELEGWQWSKLVIELEPEVDASTAAQEALLAAESVPVLDGSKLRARVTEILDRKVKSGVIGAGRARHFLRDLGSEGFTFKNYRTADLVLILTHIGCNLTLTRDYIAFRAIDDAVEESRK